MFPFLDSLLYILSIALTVALLVFLPVYCIIMLHPRWAIRGINKAYPDVWFFTPTKKKVIALTIDDAVLDVDTCEAYLDLLQRYE